MLFQTSINKEANDNNHDMWHVWGKKRGEYMVLVGKPKGGKRPIGRPSRGWEDNIKMDLPKVG